jgi:hypothetical protein
MNEERTQVTLRAIESCAYKAAHNLCRHLYGIVVTDTQQPSFQTLKDLVAAAYRPMVVELTEYAYRTSERVDKLRGMPCESVRRETAELLDAIATVPDELMPARIKQLAQILKVNLNDEGA